MFVDEEDVSRVCGRYIALVKKRINCSRSACSLDDRKRDPVPQYQTVDIEKTTRVSSGW